MKKSSFTLVAIVCLLIAGSSIASIVEPHLKNRTVHMDNTYSKLIDYIKSGAHDKYRNTDFFIKNHTQGSNKIGSCTPGLEPAPFKFGGHVVAAINEATPVV